MESNIAERRERKNKRASEWEIGGKDVRLCYVMLSQPSESPVLRLAWKENRAESNRAIFYALLVGPSNGCYSFGMS